MRARQKGVQSDDRLGPCRCHSAKSVNIAACNEPGVPPESRSREVRLNARAGSALSNLAMTRRDSDAGVSYEAVCPYRRRNHL